MARCVPDQLLALRPSYLPRNEMNMTNSVVCSSPSPFAAVRVCIQPPEPDVPETMLPGWSISRRMGVLYRKMLRARHLDTQILAVCVD